MNDSIIKILLSADDEFECEYPTTFKWEDSLDRVRTIQPKLENILNCRLELDDTIQDASYFATLTLWKHVPADPNFYTAPNVNRGGMNYAIIDISFSSFGNLVTIGSSVESKKQFAIEIINNLAKVLEGDGYFYIPEKDLREEYCGKNIHFKGYTWGERFFSYL